MQSFKLWEELNIALFLLLSYHKLLIQGNLISLRFNKIELLWTYHYLMLRIRQWFCANFNLHNILNNLLFSGNAAKNIQFRCARLVSFIHWATLMRFRKHEQLVSMRQTEMGWLDSVDKRETNYKKDNEYSLLYISIKAAFAS